MASSFKNKAPLLTWFATSMVVLWLFIAIGHLSGPYGDLLKFRETFFLRRIGEMQFMAL